MTKHWLTGWPGHSGNSLWNFLCFLSNWHHFICMNECVFVCHMCVSAHRCLERVLDILNWSHMWLCTSWHGCWEPHVLYKSKVLSLLLSLQPHSKTSSLQSENTRLYLYLSILWFTWDGSVRALVSEPTMVVHVVPYRGKLALFLFFNGYPWLVVRFFTQKSHVLSSKSARFLFYV